MDIGAESYVIASALVGVVAQRLVRRLCVHCRRQYTPPADVLRSLNIAEADAAAIPFYKSVGCDQCNHTGYRGRIGIYEVMRVTDKLRRLITVKSTEDQLREAAVAGGMITLGEDGLAKVKSGITTPEELLRVVTEVREMRTLCAGCGSAVGVDFNACPQCGKRVGGGCPHCGRAHAARLELLPVLRAQHRRGQARVAEAAARSRSRPRGPSRAARRQRRGVQEVGGAQELLRAPRDRARLRRPRRSSARSARRSPAIIPTRSSTSARNSRAWRPIAPPSSPRPTGSCRTPGAAPSTTARSPKPARAIAPPRRRHRPRRSTRARPTRSRRPRRAAAARADAAAAGRAVQGGARDPRRVRPQGDAGPLAPGARGGRRRLRGIAVARVRPRAGAEEAVVRAQQEPAAARRASCRAARSRARSPMRGCRR